ncbi:MAG: PAS domain S-box protein [bacterium]|nr:PAS domain S-box protein [bacterium]
MTGKTDTPRNDELVRLREAERALRESEAKYRELVQNANSIILRRTPAGVITFFNEYAQKFFGYSEADITGQNVVGTIVPKVDSTGRDLAAMIRDIGQSPEAYANNANENMRRNGDRVWIAWTNRPVRDEHGAVREVLCIGNDITARKQTEDALRESEEKYRAILGGIEDGYYEVDLKGSLTFFNRSLSRILGYSEDELRGMSFRRYYEEDEADRVMRTFAQVLETGESVQECDWNVTRKDGTKRVIEVSASLVCDGQGKPMGFRGIARDVTERKASEQALRESESRNRAIIDALPDSMVRFRRDGFILDFRSDTDPPPEEWTPQGLVGTYLEETIPPELADRIRTAMGRAFETGALQSFDFNLVSAGILGDYEGRLAASGDDEAVMIIRDFTDQKAAEDGLRQNELKYRTLFEACHDAVFVEKPDGTILDCNESACQLYGYPKAEMLRLNVRDLVTEDVAETLPGSALEQLKAGSIFVETIGKRNDGTVFPSEVSGLLCRIADDEVVVVYVRDITARRGAEEARRESEERYRELFENAHDIVYTHTLDGAILSLNNAAERVSGYTREEARDKNLMDVVAPEHRRKALDMVARKVAGKEPTQYEIDLIAKDGSRVAMEVSSRLIFSEGQPTAVQGIARDITERKRAEEGRARLEAQFQHAQKLESLGVLAGGIAHDFNNLLVGIMGNAGLTLSKLPAESPVRQYVERVEATAQRAAELTNQMLAYSGKGAFVLRQLDLSNLAREMGHLLEASISKKVTLKFDFDPELPLVKGDPAQLQQVLMNLITNASDAMGDDPGIVTLRTRTMDLDSEYLAGTFVDDDLGPGLYVCLEVADTGCGMDEDVKSRVFDPFYTTKFAGRGLGLAAVLGIARSHKGAIKVYSEPGRGTTFRLLVPALAGTRSCDVEAESPPQPEQGKWRCCGTILVADDGPEILEVAKETYEDCGFDVLTAVNGKEAVDLFKEHAKRIRAVLLDLTMPVMGGDEAFEAIHALRPDMPIILSSGYTEQDVSERFHGDSPTAFIQKPYVPSRLVNELRDILTRD